MPNKSGIFLLFLSQSQMIQIEREKKESAYITYLATSIDSSIKAFQPFQMKHFVQIIMSLHSFHFYRLNFFSFLDCFNALNDDGVCLSFPYRKQNRQTNQQTNKSNRYIDVCICAIRTLNSQCQSDLERNVKMAIFMHHLCMCTVHNGILIY